MLFELDMDGDGTINKVELKAMIEDHFHSRSMNKQLRERFISTLVKELRSSSVRGSDADWYIGFTPSQETPVEESEYDPRTGKIVHNTEVGTRATFLQQWDATSKGYVEEDDVQRDSGTYSYRLQQIAEGLYENAKNKRKGSNSSRQHKK